MPPRLLAEHGLVLEGKHAGKELERFLRNLQCLLEPASNVVRQRLVPQGHVGQVAALCKYRCRVKVGDRIVRPVEMDACQRETGMANCNIGIQIHRPLQVPQYFLARYVARPDSRDGARGEQIPDCRLSPLETGINRT
jgi:hypothetical protein